MAAILQSWGKKRRIVNNHLYITVLLSQTQQLPTSGLLVLGEKAQPICLSRLSYAFCLFQPNAFLIQLSFVFLDLEIVLKTEHVEICENALHNVKSSANGQYLLWAGNIANLWFRHENPNWELDICANPGQVGIKITNLSCSVWGFLSFSSESPQETAESWANQENWSPYVGTRGAEISLLLQSICS